MFTFTLSFILMLSCYSLASFGFNLNNSLWDFCQANLVLNSLSFYLSQKSLSSLYFWRTVLSGMVFLICMFVCLFVFSTLNVLSCLLACKICAEKYVNSFMNGGNSLVYNFLLMLLKLSLSLTSDHLIIMCLGRYFFEFNKWDFSWTHPEVISYLHRYLQKNK